MTDTFTHIEAIKAVVFFGEQRNDAFSALLQFEQSQIIYTVTNADLTSVLQRVLSLEINCDDLELWANLLEIRGDIDHTQVEGALYALANPDQMGALTMDKVSKLIALIDK
ncbi:hypothetical protein [Pseudoalteromonas aurantia]|uniref:Uncharacterized protein n=1 Tax=Pseudoalteromonas aurantia TaxID=43654 RepID=A0ABY2W2Q0_9GAMM|nr:hypothetical protein [Pseudoalteromonas aurantia]TMO78541.1 hypothetical protein CWC20_01395 [Pseudoalteromonas aurantia]